MVFFTLSKKLNQVLGPFLLRQGVKLRYNFARGVINDNPFADALALIPWAQKIIEIETYEAMKEHRDDPKQRASILESYIRPALLPIEEWGDIRRWQFHIRLQKWLRMQFLVARHPVPHLPKSIRQSPQLQPQFNQSPTSVETSRLPLTATVTRTFSMTQWPIEKPSCSHPAMTRLVEYRLRNEARVVRLRGGAVCFVHVEDPATDISHLSLEEVLELAGCHVAECGSFNTLCEELDIYQFWTREYVERLAQYLWKRCDTERETVILDVGAGDGLLAHLLRKQLEASSVMGARRNPPTVIASDDGSWSIGQLAEVEPWSVQETMTKYAGTDKQLIVLCSWMPMYEDWTKLFRDAGVEEYVLIGECDDGQCGDNWETWGNYDSLSLEENPTEGPRQAAPHELDGYGRSELSSLAPYQLSRFDSSGSRAGRTVSFRKNPGTTTTERHT